MLINLSGVVSSPMFGGGFDVRRRTSVVGTNGRGATSDKMFRNVRGMVVAETDGDDRNKDFTTGGKSIYVTTRFRLQDQVRCAVPDIVIWHGDEYVCLRLEDATNIGPGWVEATCTCQDLQEAAPSADQPKTE